MTIVLAAAKGSRVRNLRGFALQAIRAALAAFNVVRNLVTQQSLEGPFLAAEADGLLLDSLGGLEGIQENQSGRQGFLESHYVGWLIVSEKGRQMSIQGLHLILVLV